MFCFHCFTSAVDITPEMSPLSCSVRQIKLRSSVLLLWNARKASFGFGGAINSEFAEFSLHLPTEETF